MAERALATSINELGLLSPITVTPDLRLIGGFRRLTACKQLGWTHIPVHIVDIRSIRQGEAAENGLRKALVPSKMYEIGSTLIEEERIRAKERQGRKPEEATTETGRARDLVARYVGIGARTLEKLIAVGDAAKTDPVRFGTLLSEADATGHIDAVYQKLRQAQNVASIDPLGGAVRSPPIPAVVVTAPSPKPPAPAAPTPPTHSLPANSAIKSGAPEDDPLRAMLAEVNRRLTDLERRMNGADDGWVNEIICLQGLLVEAGVLAWTEDEGFYVPAEPPKAAG